MFSLLLEEKSLKIWNKKMRSLSYIDLKQCSNIWNKKIINNEQIKNRHELEARFLKISNPEKCWPHNEDSRHIVCKVCVWDQEDRFPVPLSTSFFFVSEWKARTKGLRFVTDNERGCAAEKHLPAVCLQVGHVLRVPCQLYSHRNQVEELCRQPEEYHVDQ